MSRSRDGTADETRQLLHLRGLIARHMKEYERAEGHFLAILEASPGDREAGNQLALALVEQADPGKRQRALELAEEALRRQPDSAAAQATLGWVYYRLGRVDDAERTLRASVSSGRFSCDTAYYLAHVLSDRGRLNEARGLLESALRARGRFTHRKEAVAWLERLTKKPQ